MSVRPFTARLRFLPIAVGALLLASTGLEAAPPSQNLPPVDFARQVQPILAKRCLFCHGTDKAKGGLRLNSRQAALAELESGEHAVVPGDVEQSELLRRISTDDPSQRMPPEGQPLPADQIELVRRWIAEGATWTEHWAFRPLAPQTVPQVRGAAWVLNPIDAFIAHQLEEAGLQPAPPADKTALLRRVYYDVTGLPPSPAEVAEFLADSSADAYEKLVDRLLASPHYGERWGRHWLDAVRFADTNSFERDTVKPHAWRFRDYVIRSFNDDKPFDQFIREQLAGDELQPPTKDSIIATGYLRLGLWDDEPADRVQAKFDVLDDVVATTAQVFLGLTINCARCHDHKIDPITQQDYYSLLAFFHGMTPMAESGANIEVPIFDGDEQRLAHASRVRQLQGQRNELQDQITDIEQKFASLYNKDRPPAEHVERRDLDNLEYRLYREEWDRLPNFDIIRAETRGTPPDLLFDLGPRLSDNEFGLVFNGTLKVPADGDYTFSLDSDDGSRLLIAGQTVIDYDGLHALGTPKTATISLRRGRLPIRLEYFQRSHARGLVVRWSGPGFVDRLLSANGQAKPREETFAARMKSNGAKLLGEAEFKHYQGLTESLQKLNHEKVPCDHALTVTEVGPQAPDTFVLVRGNAHVAGKKVEPAFPAVLGAATPMLPPRAAIAKTSGRRLALANWIASPDNRLTARVMVNRIWQHHFGRGLVRSPNNFGLLGDPPTHPELIDWLADQFVKSGWRMKSIHRLILMSSTYRMSCRADAAALAKDPTNDLFWRFNMRRLGGEEIRDSILAINGRLNSKMYGPGVYPEISAEVLAGQSRPGEGWGKSPREEQVRRSIYIHVKRSLIMPILADFDFADTDSSCPARFVTTQPTQALGMLNGQFANSEAAELAKRLRAEAGGDVQAQVGLALRLALCRDPDPNSVQRGVALIQSLQRDHALDAKKALDYFCLTVLNLNEFIYLD